jgi:nitrate reductase gamma subunit
MILLGWLEVIISNYLPYLTFVVFVVGTLYRLGQWWAAPLALNWELYPYPETESRKMAELLKEIFFIRSLFTHNRKIWYASYPFHIGLYLLVTWFLLILMPSVPNSLPIAVGWIGAIAAILGAVALIGIRLANSELRADSTFVEYLNVLLILATVSTGAYVGLSGVQVGTVRDYVFGLLFLKPIDPPTYPGFLTTLLLLQILLIYIPFSRMMHFLAKYFTYHKVKWG